MTSTVAGSADRDRLPQAPSSVVFIMSCLSFVVFISDAVFDPTLTIGGYVVLSLLMPWSLFVAFDAAWELTHDAT